MLLTLLDVKVFEMIRKLFVKQPMKLTGDEHHYNFANGDHTKTKTWPPFLNSFLGDNL